MNAPRRLPFAARLAKKLPAQWLPFADAASAELPMPRLLRLSLFQVSVGMAMALLVGTLNRVMIVELGLSAALVALMVALPIVAAPLRAWIGHRSDTHASAIGWRRVPYLFMGTGLQFSGLAIMPFALLLLTGRGEVAVPGLGPLAAALAFLLVGAGAQITQTAGLALATDLAPAATRARVVALMYVMLLVGLAGGGALAGWLLAEFSPTRLIQVVQGAAVCTLGLNVVAMWRQEARDPTRRRRPTDPAPAFAPRWQAFVAQAGARRFLWAVSLGTFAFSMQDVVLEPYGGEILRMGVGATSSLTAMMAGGALFAFALAARWLGRGSDAGRVAATGALIGLPAFALVILSAPMDLPGLFRAGTVLVGFGSGLFAVGTLTAAMALERVGQSGLALGAWGAVQATAAGAAVAFGGALRDGVSALAQDGVFGAVLARPATGYGAVYLFEILFLFAALATIGPLVRPLGRRRPPEIPRIGLADLPG